MHVDKSRRECQAVFVAHNLVGLRGKILSDSRDPVTLNANVRLEWLLSAAVIDQNIFDKNVGPVEKRGSHQDKEQPERACFHKGSQLDQSAAGEYNAAGHVQ
jgi:hypothetical protein